MVLLLSDEIHHMILRSDVSDERPVLLRSFQPVEDGTVWRVRRRPSGSVTALQFRSQADALMMLVMNSSRANQ